MREQESSTERDDPVDGCTSPDSSNPITALSLSEQCEPRIKRQAGREMRDLMKTDNRSSVATMNKAGVRIHALLLVSFLAGCQGVAADPVAGALSQASASGRAAAPAALSAVV